MASNNWWHIENFSSDLLRNIRTQVLIKLIRPYTRIAIPFISTELNIEPAEVESLLVSCILDRWVTTFSRPHTDVECAFSMKFSFSSPTAQFVVASTKSIKFWNWTRNLDALCGTLPWTNGQISCSRCSWLSSTKWLKMWFGVYLLQATQS